MVYAKFGGQTECIMGNWKIENKYKTDNSYHTTAPSALRASSLPSPGIKPKGSTKQKKQCIICRRRRKYENQLTKSTLNVNFAY